MSDSFEMIRPLLMRSMFWSPSYVASSAWLEHIPFAFWLMEALRPRSFVELGTHYGTSYFAFCHAVDRLQLDTACYAIDNWRGDEHAGFYGEDVYRAVQSHNEGQYSGFSRLVRSDFNEALGHFSDCTIDCLHIDGLHTAEAVTNDLTQWFPKLSDQAVVVLHDTNVRERSFGVFECFERLKNEYPTFEFIHGHGLGIVGVGGQQKEPLQNLFEVGEDLGARQTIREVFGRLGRNVRIAHGAQTDRERRRRAEAELTKLREAAEIAATEQQGDSESLLSAKPIEKPESEDCNAPVANRQGDFEVRDHIGREAIEVKLQDDAGSCSEKKGGRKLGIDIHIERIEDLISQLALQCEKLAIEGQKRSDGLLRAEQAEAHVERLNLELAEIQTRYNTELEEACRLARSIGAKHLEARDTIGQLENAVNERFHEEASLSRMLMNVSEQVDVYKKAEFAQTKRIGELEELTRVQSQQIAEYSSQLDGLRGATEAQTSTAIKVEEFRKRETSLLAKISELESSNKIQMDQIVSLQSDLNDRFEELAAMSKLLEEQERSAISANGSEKGGAKKHPLFVAPTEQLQTVMDRASKLFKPRRGRARSNHLREVVEASGLFDRSWYLQHNPDVAAAEIDPLDHFLLFGGKERRSPSAAFDSAAYLEANADVMAANINPLVHYLLHGRTEGRKAMACRGSNVR